MATNLVTSVMHKIFGAPTTQTAPQHPANQVPGITNNLQNNPAPTNPQQGPGTAPNGTIPPQPKEESPDVKFAKMWEPTPVDPNKKEPEVTGLTPEQMLQAAAKVDFAKVIDADTLAKIKAGGDGATEALVAAMNKVAQQTYAQTTLVADKLITAQVDRAKEDFAKQVPDLVKRQRLQDSLVKENPAFKDPAVAPIVALIQNQLAEKNPTATSDELAELAKEFFTGAASKFAPQKKSATPATKAADNVDWDEWAGPGT